MDNTKTNGLVAEMMGMKKHNHGSYMTWENDKGEHIFESVLQYDTSLEWLKPAIDKFLNIPIETFNYNAKAMAEFRSVRTSLANMPISKSIDDFYNELIAAITWYNQNKPA